MEKRYLVILMWLREDRLKGKTAHFRPTAASQKRPYLSYAGYDWRGPFWPLIDFVPCSPWFDFSAALVNSQLVCLRQSAWLAMTSPSAIGKWSINYCIVSYPFERINLFKSFDEISSYFSYITSQFRATNSHWIFPLHDVTACHTKNGVETIQFKRGKRNYCFCAWMSSLFA